MKSKQLYQSRAELLARRALGKDAITIKSALKARNVVVGIEEQQAKTRAGQIGLTTAINILARLGALAPNIYLDVPPDVIALPQVPLLSPGMRVRDCLLAFMTNLRASQMGMPIRDIAPQQYSFDLGLFIGRPTANASTTITVGSRNWLAVVNPEGATEDIDDSERNPLGIILAVALGSCEIVKHLWLPVKDAQLTIEPIQKRTVVSVFDLRLNPENPDNPAVPDRLILGHACIIGLGAIGSACNFVLNSFDQPQVSMDLVDDDVIEPSNEERLFTSSKPNTNARRAKVVHAQEFIKTVNPNAHAFPYKMKFEHFVEFDRNRLGYLFCCLDNAEARRILQTELPGIIVNGGTDMSRWMVSLHEFDHRPENACLLDLYPRQSAPTLDAIDDLAGLLRLRADQLRQFAEQGRKLDPNTIRLAMSQEQDPHRRQVISGLFGLDFDLAVAKVCSQAAPSRSIPAATASFVSLLPAICMVADFIKRRLYNWRLPKSQTNVFQFDCFRKPESGTACNILASKDCLCQSERFRAAFERRTALRKPHLNRIYETSACPVQPSRVRPQFQRRQINRPAAPKLQPPKPREAVLATEPAKAPQIPPVLRRLFGVLLWLSASGLYVSGIVVSIGLVSLFIRQQQSDARAYELWRLPQMAWNAETNARQWFKLTGVSALPVVTYSVGMVAATSMMRFGSDMFSRRAGNAAASLPGKRRNARMLAIFLASTGLPGVCLGSAGIGAVNLHLLLAGCGQSSGAACCFAIPFFVFGLYVLLIICAASVMQVFGPTWHQSAKVFHIPVHKKKAAIRKRG